MKIQRVTWIRITALWRVQYTAMIGADIVGKIWNTNDGGYEVYHGQTHRSLRDAKREVESALEAK